MNWTDPRDYAINPEHNSRASQAPFLRRAGRPQARKSATDYGSIPPTFAIMSEYAPFICKAIVVGLFGLVAGICAACGWNW